MCACGLRALTGSGIGHGVFGTKSHMHTRSHAAPRIGSEKVVRTYPGCPLKLDKVRRVGFRDCECEFGRQLKGPD